MSNITRLISKNPAYYAQYQQTAARYFTPAEASYTEVRPPGPTTDQYLRSGFRKFQADDRLHNAHSFWYNPATDYRDVEKDPITGNKPKLQSIYFGESYDKSRPTWEIPVVNYAKYSDYLKSESASTDRQASRFDKVMDVFYPEVEEDAYGYLKSLEADVMTSGDFSNMQLVTSFIDVLDTQQRDFSLINAVSTKATDVLNVMTAYSRFQITEEISELEAPESRKGKFDTQQFKLKKSGGSLAWSDEFMMQNWIIDPYSYASQNLSTDVVRVKAKKIATALTGLTTATTSTGNFSTFASDGTLDHAEFNPLLIFSGMRNGVY